MTKEIELTKGYVTLIDDDVYEELNKYKWHYHEGYALRMERVSKNRRRYIRMHRVIMNTPDGMEPDHINGNSLDNRKSNLRNCTHAENSCNSKIQINNTSGYKGVSWNKLRKKWSVKVVKNQEHIFLGLYTDKKEAVMVYNKNAKEMFGEFARLNSIKENE
jgi:hypothetical protein